MEEIGTLELERIRLRPCEDREELLSNRIKLARCTIARGDEELRPIRERVLELERILRDTPFFPDSSSNNAAKPDSRLLGTGMAWMEKASA